MIDEDDMMDHMMDHMMDDGILFVSNFRLRGLCRWCDGGVSGHVRSHTGECMGYHSASGQDTVTVMHL